MENKKVAVAMSGGVDSGVAAALLVKEGYHCEGFHLKLLKDSPKEPENFARATAKKLKIPFHLLDLSSLFQKEVIENFLQDYLSGLTPNPCVVCNKLIKFGELWCEVRKLGFDLLATGHYARVIYNSPDRNFSSVSDSLAKKRTLLNKNYRRSQSKTSQNLSGSLALSSTSLHGNFRRASTFHLLSGVDKSKDQSYFLYNLNQEQLAHLLFPLGEYQKKEVVAMAEKWKLPVAHRPESQEICFLRGKDYRTFLKENSPSFQPGEVVDLQGRIIGQHEGLPLYTIGQRHGFVIRTKNIEHRTKGIIPPFYVIGKNVKKNQLIVGFGQETERKEFWVREVNWINPSIISHQPLIINCLVRVRHQGQLLKCKVRREIRNAKHNSQDKKTSSVSRFAYHVSLTDSERGIAPGQAAVFYQKLETGDYEVLGGGIISLDND